jgi:hypothetical protein
MQSHPVVAPPRLEKEQDNKKPRDPFSLLTFRVFSRVETLKNTLTFVHIIF